MRKLVSYTDFLAICTARNERQARAIVDEAKLRLKDDARSCSPAAPTARARRAGSCSITSTRSSTSSPRRPGSATSSRTSGERRRGSIWDVRRCRPRAPLRCRAWVASRGPSWATAAPKWTRQCPHGTGESSELKRELDGEGRDRERAASSCLSGMVIEREREIRLLGEQLQRGQRAPRPQHRLARRGHRPAPGDRGAGARPGDPDPDESAARGGRGRPPGPGALRGRGSRRPQHARSSRARSGSRSARSATTPSWSGSRTRSASSAPPRSRSSASPRAGRRSR